MRRSGRHGAAVAEIKLCGDLKEKTKLRQPELGLPPPSAGASNRVQFRTDGCVRWVDFREPSVRDHRQGREVDRLRENFVGFCERRDIPLDAKTIAKTLVGSR